MTDDNLIKTNEISSKKQNLSKKTLQRTGRISTETDTNININEKNPSKQTNDKSKFKEIKSQIKGLEKKRKNK